MNDEAVVVRREVVCRGTFWKVREEGGGERGGGRVELTWLFSS